jgi:FixJ family two-component response regulator
VSENSVISIVDDDVMVREATWGFLRAMGFQAEMFGGPEEFLESGRQHNTSCLIADMRMPGMSGLDLYSHLVASGAPVPTILITGSPLDHDRKRALRLGVVTYLTKPFQTADLLAAIRTVLG